MRVNEYHSFVFQMQETRTRLRRIARETVSVNKPYTNVSTQSANPPDGFAARYRSKSARLPAAHRSPSILDENYSMMRDADATSVIQESSPVPVKSEQEAAPGSLRCCFPAANRVMLRNSSRSVAHASAVFLRSNKSTSGILKQLKQAREAKSPYIFKEIREAECPADGVAVCLLWVAHSITHKMA
jgi:hypothetical protein